MLKLMFVSAAALIAAPVLAQEAPAAAPAAPALPYCSAKVTDSCQQTPKQEARAMTGAQVDKRDAGGQWTPDQRAKAAAAKQ